MNEFITALITAISTLIISWIIFTFSQEYRSWKTSIKKTIDFLMYLNRDALENLSDQSLSIEESLECYVYLITFQLRFRTKPTEQKAYVSLLTDIRNSLHNFTIRLAELINKYNSKTINDFFKTTEPMTRLIGLWLIREFNYCITIPRKIFEHPKNKDDSSS